MITLSSMGPVKIKGWVIQGSVLNNETICLIFYNPASKSSIVKFFMDEEFALEYLRYVTETTAF